MSRRDDDLSPFRDDPVFRALTGPATSDELVGEADILAAFRAANASRPMRRFAARVGTSGAVAVVAVALSAGAAAAYTAELPAPLQQIVHDAAGPIGVPAPKHHPHHPGSGGSKSSSPTVAGPAPAVAPTGTPGAAAGGTTRPHLTPTSLPSSPTSSPVVTSTAPIVVGAPSPTPTQSRKASLVGASLTLTITQTEVQVGSITTVTGQLDGADRTPIEGRRVGLFERLTGEPHWTRVGDAVVTSATGGAMFTVPVDHNARFVLRARRHVHSSVVKVVALPVITVTPAPSETTPGQETVSVTVTGGEEGDVIGLNWFAGRKRHQQTTLDAAGTATFTVRVPQHRTVTYQLYLRGTQAHGVATQSFPLPPA
jgi:hypothetical protein